MTARSESAGEYAQGTMPRKMAEITAEYVRNLADHPAMAGADATWLMGAQELIYSLLHCLDVANADLRHLTGSPAPWRLTFTLGGKLANLVYFVGVADASSWGKDATADYSEAMTRLRGLAADPELAKWAEAAQRQIGVAKVTGTWPPHVAPEAMLDMRAEDARVGKSTVGPLLKSAKTDEVGGWLIDLAGSLAGLRGSEREGLLVAAERIKALEQKAEHNYGSDKLLGYIGRALELASVGFNPSVIQGDRAVYGEEFRRVMEREELATFALNTRTHYPCTCGSPAYTRRPPCPTHGPQGIQPTGDPRTDEAAR